MNVQDFCPVKFIPPDSLPIPVARMHLARDVGLEKVNTPDTTLKGHSMNAILL